MSIFYDLTPSFRLYVAFFFPPYVLVFVLILFNHSKVEEGNKWLNTIAY